VAPDDGEPVDPNLDAELNDPDLAIVAGAILDGTPVDWTAAAASVGARYSDTFRRLRVLADLAALHRSLTHQVATDSSADTSPALPVADRGREWGPLTLRERIGAGAFGEVFRAWDNRLDREVALKLLRRVSGQSDVLASASIDEGRLLARVRHPNVVSVYGAERLDGRIGIWTEFIHGRTLAEFVRQHGRFSAQEAMAVGIDLCRALSAIHKAGLLHRDLKPQNVMREEGGRIVLMDFGAGRERVAETIGGDGDLAGTPLYLAPELWRGAEATPQSDIYSLGVLLYFLVTETHPVRGRTMQEVREAHGAGRHTLLRDERPDLPDGFIDVVEGALAADPTRRYETAGVFEAALKRAQSSLEHRTPAVDQATAIVKPASSFSRWIVWTAAAAVVLAAGAALFFDAGRLRTRWMGGSGGSPTGYSPVGLGASTSQRKVAIPGEVLNTLGRPSRDGRYFPYIGEDGNLFYWDQADGTSHRVTSKPAGSQEGVSLSAMSPDGRHVAYTWWTLDNAYDLRVSAADGSAPHNIVPRQAAELPQPIEWSADGTQVLCWLEHSDGSTGLGLAAADGSLTLKILYTFRRGQPRQVSLSPDAQFVVYDAPRDLPSLQSQLVIVGMDGAPPRVLIDEPADDFNPFWTPDGQRVFFTSDRSGSIDGWVVDVVRGVAIGEPTRVAGTLARVGPVALTGDGAYYHWLDTTTFDVYTMPVDLSSGSPPGKPDRVPAAVGGHVAPGWSSSGRLAYIKRVPSRSTTLNRGLNLLTVLEADGRTHHDVLPQLSELSIDPPRWSPDNRHVIVKGRSLQNQLGYFQLDVDTGETAPIVVYPFEHEGSYTRGYRWSPDGGAMIYVHNPRGIVSHELATGKEVVLVDRKANRISRFCNFAVAPDGLLAFGARTQEHPGCLLFIQTGNGAPREIFRPTDVNENAFVQDWTPDGRILVSRFKNDQNAEKDPHQLWTISPRGEPQDTNIRIAAFTDFYRLAVSPDGHRLAYTLGKTSADLWVMERFLPPRFTAPGGHQLP
jgi:Tol biopolymer transport system component